MSLPDPTNNSLTGAVRALLEASQRRGLVWRLSISGLVVLATLALRVLLLGPLGSGLTYVTFYPAVAIAASVGRLAGGMFAVALSAVLAHAVVSPLETTADWLGLLTFLVSGVLITGIAEVLHVTVDRRLGARQAQELAATRQLLAAIVDSTDDAVMAFDTEGRITSWNRAAEALFGYSAREAIGRGADLLVKPLGRILPGETARGAFDRALAGERFQLDTLHVAKDGTVIDVSVTATQIKGSDGRVLGVSAIMRDIRDRKRSEAALRESEERLRLALGASRAGAWSWDLPRDIISISDGCCDLYGLSSATPITSAEWLALVHRDDRDRVSKETDQALRSGADVHHEYRINHPELGERWIEVTGRVERNGEGRAVRVVGIDMDVTERRRTEAALRESEARLAGLVTSAMDAIISVDEQQRISLFNPAAEKLFGISAREAAGQPLAQFIPDRLRGAHEGHVRRFGQSGVSSRRMSARGECRALRTNGEEFLAEISISQTRVAGGRLYSAIVRDVTERKRAEERLSESEQRLRAIFNHQFQYSGLLTPEGKVVDMSESALRAVGALREEVVGRDFVELPVFTRVPETQALWRRQFADALSSGSSARAEASYHAPDGSLRHALNAATALRDEHGTVKYLLVEGIDFTERKQAEEALRESEERLRFALSGVEAAAWQWIIKTNEQIWSPDSYRLHGRDPKLGPPDYEGWRQCVHPDDRAATEQAVLDALNKSTPDYRTEYRVALASGEVRWLAALGKVDFAADGTPVSMSGINLDITEKKRAQAALAATEEQLRLCTEAGDIGTFTVDLRSGLVHYSAMTAAMIGFPTDRTFTFDDALTRVHRDDHAQVRQEYEAALDPRGTGRLRLELRFVRPGGEIRWMTWNGCVEFSDTSTGRVPHRVLGVCIDTTERRQMVEALARANADLERKVAERTAALALEMEGREEAQSRLALAQRLEATGRLAGGLAHDFNNTLAAIAAHLEFAKPRIADAKAADGVEAALDAVEMGASLNRRLLSVAARRKSPPSIAAIDEPLRAVLHLVGRTLGTDIVIAPEIDPDLWPARFDPGELEGAILNLVINARDAMSAGGTLVIAARNVTLDALFLPAGCSASAGDFVRISVRDSGVGMAPEVKARAGEPFFTTKIAARGTGLGLSSVSEFVRAAGGFMTIDSAVGAGTEVALHLPRARGPSVVSAAPGAGRSQVPLGDGELVLLIDDDERVLEATHKLLEGLGYAVVGARSGPEAMTLLRQGEPPQVVLSDVIMPGGMSGFDVAHRVRAEHPAVKILLVSGHWDDSSDCPDGMVVLRKPYSRLEIAEALWAAVHGSDRAPSCSTSPANT